MQLQLIGIVLLFCFLLFFFMLVYVMILLLLSLKLSILLSLLMADTTDVQSSTITGSDHQLNVTCFFAVGTLAKGCVVYLEKSGEVVYQMIPRVNGTAKGVIRTEFSVDCYNISVMDWEEDGSMGSLPVPVNSAISSILLHSGSQRCGATSGTLQHASIGCAHCNNVCVQGVAYNYGFGKDTIFISLVLIYFSISMRGAWFLRTAYYWIDALQSFTAHISFLKIVFFYFPPPPPPPSLVAALLSAPPMLSPTPVRSLLPTFSGLQPTSSGTTQIISGQTNVNYFVLCNQSNLNVNADSSLMVERDNSSIEIISAGAICGVAILSVVMVVAMVLGCHLKTRKSMIFISQCLIVVNWNFWTALDITSFFCSGRINYIPTQH